MGGGIRTTYPTLASLPSLFRPLVSYFFESFTWLVYPRATRRSTRKTCPMLFPFDLRPHTISPLLFSSMYSRFLTLPSGSSSSSSSLPLCHSTTIHTITSIWYICGCDCDTVYMQTSFPLFLFSLTPFFFLFLFLFLFLFR
ncbi:hypothetical protein K402DRAFT_191977 [Aulographum hederae CBS 113979]|uniref:Uncharacterized protein n=1 Tax=Aulographum hederae CBS 113979 TaxID=1176131 RepID=A0A6G1GPC4_9PEZI|nr:hypothetical protein K402DRAFT_191977 [Aulographum hederae CBS 113979]